MAMEIKEYDVKLRVPSDREFEDVLLLAVIGKKYYTNDHYRNIHS